MLQREYNHDPGSESSGYLKKAKSREGGRKSMEFDLVHEDR